MRLALATAVALAAAVLSVPAANAAGPSSEPVTVTTEGDFCAYNGVTEEIACVDDEADIEVAHAAIQGGATAARGGIAPLATVWTGRFYDNVGYSTAAGYIDYFGSSTCTSSVTTRDFGWSPMGAWANRISSFTGQGGCFIKLWTNAGYTGSSLGYQAQSNNVGTTMNDKTKSVEFS